jgi:hypothetical protein
MSKASGFVLILAGLAAAAYGLPSGTDPGDLELPQFSEVAKTPPDVGSSPKAPVQVAAAPEARSEARPVPPSPAPVVARLPAATMPAPIVVTLAPRHSEPAAPAARPSPLLRDRDTIGRELQKELKRVGCYEGELNGAWTPLTRQAMKSFTDRVNATLPVDEPDSILLTLVQAYQDRVCGKPCPTGQGMNDAGRCVPNAILARSNKKPAPVVAAAPLEPKPAPAITGWSTTTTTVPTATAGVAPPVVTAPYLPGAQPPAPLPGDRMALAGPTTPEGTPPGTLPPAATPPATKPTPKARGTNWARGVFNMRDSPN